MKPSCSTLWLFAFAVLVNVLPRNDMFSQQALSINEVVPQVGIAASLGGAAGGLGLNVLSRRSESWTISAGVGYWPGLDFHVQWFDAATQTTRREFSVFLSSRNFARNGFNVLTGVCARRIEGSLEAFGQKTEAALGSVGFPLAIGFEIGRTEVLTVNIETGFAMFFGPGADDTELSVHQTQSSAKTTISGSSGLLVGVGLNYYFR